MFFNSQRVMFKRADDLYRKFLINENICLVNTAVGFCLSMVITLIPIDLCIDCGSKNIILIKLDFINIDINIFDLIKILMSAISFGIILFVTWYWDWVVYDIKYCRISLIREYNKYVERQKGVLVEFDVKNLLRYFLEIKDQFSASRKTSSKLIIADVVSFVLICLIVQEKNFFIFCAILMVYAGILWRQIGIFNDYNKSIRSLQWIIVNLDRSATGNKIKEGILMQYIGYLYNDNYYIRSMVRMALEYKIFRLDSFLSDRNR